MAEHGEEKETLMEKIADKIHGGGSSSSDSDNEESKVEVMKAKVYRLFGREKPVHHVLGGGKSADVLLWRNKKISGGVVGVATAIWVLFELLEYHLLTLVCHCLILSLAILFLWSNASTFINKSPPCIPEVSIPEDVVRNAAFALRNDINRGLATLREIASGREIKKFLAVIAILWILSILGSSCNFLTLFYVVFIVLHTVPVLYEKYDDKIDAFAEKAMIELKKHYAVFDAKVLCKIPKGPLKGSCIRRENEKQTIMQAISHNPSQCCSGPIPLPAPLYDPPAPATNNKERGFLLMLQPVNGHATFVNCFCHDLDCSLFVTWLKV